MHDRVGLPSCLGCLLASSDGSFRQRHLMARAMALRVSDPCKSRVHADSNHFKFASRRRARPRVAAKIPGAAASKRTFECIYVHTCCSRAASRSAHSACAPYFVDEHATVVKPPSAVPLVHGPLRGRHRRRRFPAHALPAHPSTSLSSERAGSTRCKPLRIRGPGTRGLCGDARAQVRAQAQHRVAPMDHAARSLAWIHLKRLSRRASTAPSVFEGRECLLRGVTDAVCSEGERPAPARPAHARRPDPVADALPAGERVACYSTTCQRECTVRAT